MDLLNFSYVKKNYLSSDISFNIYNCTNLTFFRFIYRQIHY
ncbi:hypothetical protein PROSTU_02343 [Providencia stuartii ATCC 25827]|uniref:Uncharacterized protein n=1 Tax=Providencia stuartii ATCC 25827 TaxID=471874 RepID=A0AA86YIX3_PROST|nr:hypothetical protein PROSTU_02343 [Providencia stuartii ATCC 25827]